MDKYLQSLNQLYSPRTCQRKIDYIRYNFASIFRSHQGKKLSVLEIGPGMGEMVKFLNNRGIKDIDIIDNDKGVVTNIISKYNINSGLVTDDIKKIETKLRSYDLIVLIQILEHLPPVRHIDSLRILYKHLNKGGSIVIVVPNAGNPLGMVERYGDLQHQTSFTERSLKDLVVYSDIKDCIVQIRGFEIPPYDLLNIIRVFLQKILHGFLILLLIINGGIFFKTMTPNIMLVITKKS